MELMYIILIIFPVSKIFAKYIFQSVCLFVTLFAYLQHNSKSTAQMKMKFLGSIKTATRKNTFKFGRDWVNIWIREQSLKSSPLAPMNPNARVGEINEMK